MSTDEDQVAVAGTIGDGADGGDGRAEAENEPEPITLVQGESDDASALAEILAVRKRVAVAESRYLVAKEAASDAKKSWEASVEELTDTIDRVTRPLPLFDGKKDGDTGNASDANAATQAADDSWKSDPLGVLNLDDNVETFIQDAGHKTLGELSAYMAGKGEFWAKDMAVGGRRKPPKFQAKVEAAYEEFWKRRVGRKGA